MTRFGGRVLAGGVAELLAACRVGLFDMEGDVAVGELLAFDPQLDLERTTLGHAQARERLADHRLADADGVGRPGLLASAGLLPVLLLGRLDVIAVVAGAEAVVADQLDERVGDLGAAALGADAGVEERGEVGLGEREGGHVGAQRDGLHDVGLGAVGAVLVSDLFDLVTPRRRDRLFEQS